MMPNATVHVVDDDATIHRALQNVLGKSGYDVACYDSAEAFLDALPDNPLGCIILDLQMPGMNGIELQRELERRAYRMPIIFLSGQATIESAVEAVKRGAHDFLQKPASFADLLDKVTKAIQAAHDMVTVKDRVARLTNRESQVMSMVVSGKTNRESAALLGISLSTVEYHRANMMKKLGAESLADLITLYRQI